jgi:hypothetical protein
MELVPVEEIPTITKQIAEALWAASLSQPSQPGI